MWFWVHQTFPKLGACAWQDGYSVFSVSKSQEEGVKKYIAGQAEHHKKEDFKTELFRLLRAMESSSTSSTCLIDPFRVVVPALPPPLPGRCPQRTLLSTGCASARFAVAPLHPRLQPSAPLGRCAFAA